MFKDLVWDVEVEVTNEQSDKDAIMTTLTTVMQTIGANPAVLQDPNMKMLFNKILEATGSVSAIEMTQIPAVQNKAPVNKVSESISFKDLPPDGQVQMAKQAGINISSAPVTGNDTTPKVGGSIIKKK